MSHYALQSIDPSQRVTSMQFEPSALYSPSNFVRDYVWIRPYAGSGFTISRQTLSDLVAGVPSVSENKTGLRVFGGGEFTFASVPRFALSVDLGYHWAR